MLTNTTNDICSFRRSKQFNFPLFMAAPKIFHRSPLSLHFCCSSPATLLRLRKPGFTSNSKFFLWMPNNSRAFKSINHTNRNAVLCCLLRTTSENDKNEVQKENERPAFDLNLAVVLAGFAFEAYSSPPENLGAREIDAAECQTVFLSETFLREVYDGQLFIKLKKGADFPAMDPWGTSDPYVVIQLDSQIIKSKIKWATKEPIWNEEFTINIKKPPIKNLQIAAWDANLVTPHKRMGNAAVSLESLCNGELHELQVELGGMGGGGKVYLEVKYKSFEEIDAEKQGWRIPFVLDFLTANNFGSALKMVLGSERIQARQFVESAFGHMRSLGSTYLPKNLFSEIDNQDMVGHEKSLSAPGDSNWHPPERSPEGSADNSNCIERNTLANFETETDVKGIGDTLVVNRTPDESKQSDDCFWKQITEVINKKVEGFGIQNLGFSIPEEVMWDGLDLLNKIGLQSRRAAEAEYVESGLATPKSITDGVAVEPTSASQELQSSPVDIEKASGDVLRQMDAIFGGLMVLTAAFSQQKGETNSKGKDGTLDASRLDVDGLTKSSVNEKEDINMEGVKFDQSQAEEMKALFLTAESAMEAWAMLATALGRPSFIQSEFEKICFLDNVSTDTQVAIWRDSVQKRLVIAFRGTEQVRWKDLRTDLMLAPTGLNPERLGGDFKEEVQVHSGFLGAYDSVRNRIMSFIKTSIGFVEDSMEILPTWHVYVTGHSLGGALATLLALELSSSQMAKNGMISVTMYNFGSPRVGNKRFVEAYNEKVKDSWRIVNHRDIIPTVPRLMGYCHVAQPVYLSTGNLQDALVNMELLEDGYQGDVIGESTPDVLVSEFMKGEKQLIEQILQTEINLFRSIRDGSALMQHMEDFYYITLLEATIEVLGVNTKPMSVRAHYRTSNNSSSKSENKILTA